MQPMTREDATTLLDQYDLAIIKGEHPWDSEHDLLLSERDRIRDILFRYMTVVHTAPMPLPPLEMTEVEYAQARPGDDIYAGPRRSENYEQYRTRRIAENIAYENEHFGQTAESAYNGARPGENAEQYRYRLEAAERLRLNQTTPLQATVPNWGAFDETPDIRVDQSPWNVTNTTAAIYRPTQWVPDSHNSSFDDEDGERWDWDVERSMWTRRDMDSVEAVADTMTGFDTVLEELDADSETNEFDSGTSPF